MKSRTSLLGLLLISVAPMSQARLLSSSTATASAEPRQLLDIRDKDNHDPMEFEKKQVVFFAGPHSAASTSVEEFMGEWAKDGHQGGHPHSIALQYWRWPRVQGAFGEHGVKVFGRMVTEPKNTELINTILGAIKAKYEEAENGVIVGTEEFDQVGPDATFDGLAAMKKIVQHLALNNDEDVTVVLNYRAPRLDQWVSIWKHQEGDFMDSTYEDFLCLAHNDKRQQKIRFDMLGAQMNPLNAAKIFLEQGWKVKLIDMGGVEKANKDISHVIGCRVLLGGCHDGFLGSLGEELPRENAIEKPFDELNDEESAKMEELFRNRDCGYQPLLQEHIDNGNMEIEYKDTLWSSCDSSRKSYYSDLVGNTDVLFHAFLSQLDCKDNPYRNENNVNMDIALGHQNGITRAFNGLVEAVLVPLVFLGGVGYVILMMMKGNEQRRLDQNRTAVGAAEMTAYPSAAFQDGHDEEGEFQDEPAANASTEEVDDDEAEEEEDEETK